MGFSEHDIWWYIWWPVETHVQRNPNRGMDLRSLQDGEAIGSSSTTLLSSLVCIDFEPCHAIYNLYIYITRCLIVWYCLIWLSQIGFGKTSFSLYAKPRDPHPDQGASNVWKELSPSIASPSAKGISHLCLEEVENRTLFMTTWCTKNIKKMAIDIHRES